MREKTLVLEVTADFFTLLNSLPKKKSHDSKVRIRKCTYHEVTK